MGVILLRVKACILTTDPKVPGERTQASLPAMLTYFHSYSCKQPHGVCHGALPGSLWSGYQQSSLRYHSWSCCLNGQLFPPTTLTVLFSSVLSFHTAYYFDTLFTWLLCLCFSWPCDDGSSVPQAELLLYSSAFSSHACPRKGIWQILVEEMTECIW